MNTKNFIETSDPRFIAEVEGTSGPLRPVVLAVLDGFGIRVGATGNAIELASTPNLDRFTAQYDHCLLEASGPAVGLPAGVVGNSEVGHMTLGAGQVLPSPLVRIDQSIADGTFGQSPLLAQIGQRLIHEGSALHIVTLLSMGQVHSSLGHLYAALDWAAAAGLANVHLHLITDGRDAGPTDSLAVLEALQERMLTYPSTFGVRIATISGRSYAMDRNTNWSRTKRAYDAMVGEGNTTLLSTSRYLQAQYNAGITDEFIEPILFDPTLCVHDHDALLFLNFRPDRMRQLVAAFTAEVFTAFNRPHRLNLFTASMTEYDEKFEIPVLYPSPPRPDTLGQQVSRLGLSQLRIAETEKYAHVTYFFNGGNEETLPGETRVMVPSRHVVSFDQDPGMATNAITEKILEVLTKQKTDLIVVNYAAPDMVAHTGNLDATKHGLEILDAALGRLESGVLRASGRLIVTSDHGNAETLIKLDGTLDTEHNTSPVPLWCIGSEFERDSVSTPAPAEHPGLSVVAPLVLSLLTPKPKPKRTRKKSP